MNEYLYEIMNDVDLTEEDWDAITTNRKVAKRYRGYLDSQICLFDTLDFEP